MSDQTTGLPNESAGDTGYLRSSADAALRASIGEDEGPAAPAAPEPDFPNPGVLLPGTDSRPAAPLGRVRTPEMQRASEQEGFRQEASEIGYKEMPLDLLPSGGRMYPALMQVQYRAATIDEIKHYSAMDEADLRDVDARIAQVLDKCLRVRRPGGLGSYRDLEETDKIYLLFAIREFTMAKQNREVKLNQLCECPKCGESKKVEITNETFGYYEIDEGIAQWYSEDERCFKVEDPELGGDGILRLYVPTIGTMQFLAKYMIEKEQKKREGGEGGFYDPQHLSFLQFLVKDYRDLSADYVKRHYQEFKNKWTYDRHVAVEAAVKLLNFGIRPTVAVTCGKEGCGHEFQAVIRFRDGFASILNVSSIGSKLFGTPKQALAS